ncbi:transposase [Amphritea opalescens]|uniref:Transposase n=2 Tax=Amphritea opalescens TaxID=2490544 RepID=A0A430KP38_9GAMM|nr:transposase [Amphritea opalescens]
MKGNSSALRKGRYSEPGRIYLITFVTSNREHLLANLYCGRLVAASLNFSGNPSDTLAYVVMPDHIHWLVQLKKGSLNHLVRSVKTYSARQINKHLSRLGPVWQKGFHDHALRHEEDLINLARYIVMNPVRAGLVRNIREYALWDAVWL